ncbi:MAG: DUF6443 domain-containing protein [Bacteroidota bacterium]
MKKSLYLLLAVLLSPLAVNAQTTTQNYVKSVSYQVETTSGNVDNAEKIESVTYYDGLGRPLQSVSQRAGGNGEDLVTPMTYDHLGRQEKQYLPYVHPNLNNNGAYTVDAIGPLSGYYATKFENDLQ